MPEILERCVTKLKNKGYAEESAWAICTDTLKKAGKLSENIDIDVLIEDYFINRHVVYNEILPIKDELTDVELIRTGYFYSPIYGDLDITEEMFDSFIRNFNNNVLGRDIAIDIEHDITAGAAAWLKKLSKVKRENEVYLIGTLEFTPVGKDYVNNKLYKYFSLDFMTNYRNKENPDENYGPVILGGALTNRPFIPNLRPITYGEKILFSEKMFNFSTSGIAEVEDMYKNINERLEMKYRSVASTGIPEELKFEEIRDIPWSKIDKTKLPASAFAYVPDRDKRSTWKLPYRNPDGSINPNGVAAAVAAIHGARGGVKGVSRDAIKKIMDAWEKVKVWREKQKKRQK